MSITCRLTISEVDYMAALDVHPLRPQMTMNSSACGGKRLYLPGKNV